MYTVLGLKRVSVSTDAHNENYHDVNNLTPNEFHYLSQKEKTMSDLPWNQDKAKGKHTGTKWNHTRPNAFRRPQRRAPARNSTKCLDNQNSNKPIRDDIQGMINAQGRRGQGALRMPLRTCCVHVLHTQVRLTGCEQLMEKVMVLPRVHCVTGSVTYLE